MKIFSFFILTIPAICFPAFEMTNISFMQGKEVSKVIFEFDKKGVRVSKFQNEKDKQIIVDLRDVKASPRVMRAFDTSEFKGAAIFVSPYKRPGNPSDVRVAIQLRDNVRSIMEPRDNRLILNIENRFGVFSSENLREKVSVNQDFDDFTGANLRTSSKRLNVPKSNKIEDILENITLSGKKRYIGKKIHFDVKNIMIGDLLQMLADASGFNIIVDDAVNSATPITLSLVNTPWDQALDIILDLSKLVAKKNGNILIITTLEKATKERTLELKAKTLLEVQEPLVTKVFPH